MQSTTHDKRCEATFAIDGFEISATFADSHNAAALGKSSRFCCQLLRAASPKNGPEASLQSTRNRGIIIVGVLPMYLENYIFPTY